MKKILITYDDYIKNPMSKENAVFSHREMYAGMYKDKLNKIMVRENGEVKYFLYTSSDKYYVYIKIPSEIVPEFYYDVVIEFSPNSTISRSIKDYNVKCYSNDPSFVFTFAHAFIENGLFINELQPKMSKEAISNVAKEKNPSNQVGYVKSLYFAYLIMKDRGLFDKIKFESEASPLNLRDLLSKIEDADIKVSKRTEAGANLKKNKNTKKPTNDKERNSNLNSPFREKNTKQNLDIKTTSVVSLKNNMKKNISQTKKTINKNIGVVKKF